MLNGLDLFSGIGGLSVALNEWVRPIAYCEIDPYCEGIILSRIYEGRLPFAPLWDNITTLKAGDLPTMPDILFGGFPCQGISCAGLGKGLADERSGLFFEIVRLAKEIQPRFLFIENVPNIATKGGLTVVREITALGYDCRWCVISAASVGACHKRDRWFLLAHPLRTRCSDREAERQNEAPQKSALRGNWNQESMRIWQEVVSTMGRTTDGIPNRVDRIKGLGNAVVPIQAKTAFKILMGL